MEEIDIKELIGLFWSKKLEIILITVVLAVMGCVYSYTMITPKYKASTTLVLAKITDSTTTDSITQTDITINSKLVATYSELVKSKSVLREVLNNLQIEGITEESLRKNIKVTSVEDTEIIKIQVENEDAEKAALIANAVAEVFSVKVAEIYKINNVYIVDQAEISETPSNVNHIKDIAIFSAIGMVIGFVEVLLIKLLDNKIRTAQDVEKETNLLVLASIPKNVGSRNRRRA